MAKEENIRDYVPEEVVAAAGKKIERVFTKDFLDKLAFMFSEWRRAVSGLKPVSGDPVSDHMIAEDLANEYIIGINNALLAEYHQRKGDALTG